MKIKEMSKKLISSFLVLAIMLIPTMAFATEGDTKTEENYITDASQIKLLDKIQFSGYVYKKPDCEDAKALYSGQSAVVTEITHRDEGVLGVTFTREGKILSSFGYIKVEKSKVLQEGQLITLNFKLFEDEAGEIEINGKKYDIDANTTIQLANGGIKINDEFISLKEGDELKFVDVQGSFGLENNKDGMIDRFVINGNATFKITSNGFIVSGDAKVNGEKVEGEVEVTFEGENVTIKIVNAEIDGKELKESSFKTVVIDIIKKIINLIKEIFSKLFGNLF